MQDRTSFVLYTEYRKHLDLLTDEQCGRLFRAIMMYAATGESPEMDAAERMAFSFIQAQMERDNAKYENTRQERSKAGKLGGRPRKAKETIAFDEKQKKQSEAKKAVDVDVDVDVLTPHTPQGADDVSESLTVELASGTANEAVDHSTTSRMDARFGEFWAAYPKKVGKMAARRVWDKLHPTAALHTAMLSAVAAQVKTDQWRRDGGQYIPHPATWLNQGRWEDEPGPGGKLPPQHDDLDFLLDGE